MRLAVAALFLPILLWSQGSQIDYPSQVKNGPSLSDAGYPAGTQFSTICAQASGQTISVTQKWLAMRTQSLNCNLAFNGGSFQTASGQAVTFTGACPVAASYQIFDVTTNTYPSGAGSVVLPACPYNVPVEWYGAGKSGSANDQPFLQAAIYGNMTCATACSATNTLQLSAKTYPITSTLYGYNQAAGKEIIGFSIVGQSSQESIISYSGPTNTPALKIVSPGQRLQNFYVLDAGSGWSTGLDYDGISGIGISSQSVWDHVFINCGYQPGDGVQIGPGGGQADQLTITNASQIWGCISGIGLNNTFNPNSVSIIYENSSFFADYIGIKGGSSNNVSMIGGEIDDCAINFWPGLGGAYLFSHFRTETSGRQQFSAPGAAPQSVRYDTAEFGSVYDLRPTTTATTVASSSSVTLSVTGTIIGAVQFTCGDAITIAGSGSGTMTITGCSSPSSVTVSPAPVNSVSGAAVALVAISTSYPQDQFQLGSLGAYSFVNCQFGQQFPVYASGATNPMLFSYNVNAAISIQDSNWSGLGLLTSTIFGDGNPLTASVTLKNNYVDTQNDFGGEWHLYDWLPQSPSVSFALFKGANNAITAPFPAQYSGYLLPAIQPPGLLITGELSNTLQAGANTLSWPDGRGIGTVTTSGAGGNTVTSVTGTGFSTSWSGGALVINNFSYPLSSCSSTTVCTVTGNPGTQTGVKYYTAVVNSILSSVNLGNIANAYAGNGFITLLCVNGGVCVDMKQ